MFFKIFIYSALLWLIFAITSNVYSNEEWLMHNCAHCKNLAMSDDVIDNNQDGNVDTANSDDSAKDADNTVSKTYSNTQIQAQEPTKESFWQKTKRTFFDKDLYSQRAKKAESTYEHCMILLEHEGTYFIYSYSLPPFGVYGNNIPNELKFQLSLKVPMWRGAFWSKGSLFFAYTQTMWFQQSNFEYSSPVRDTNYKPQIFYSYPGNWNFLGGKLKELRIGFEHFSNGIGGDECFMGAPGASASSACRSRSAGNRIIFSAIWERGGFGMQINAWPYMPSRRDNPDLVYYLGYADAKLYYRYKRNLVELQVGPIISDYTNYHGYARLGYSFAINRWISIYAQYFIGYMDSLYEYNIPAQRIGVGVRSTSF